MNYYTCFVHDRFNDSYNIIGIFRKEEDAQKAVNSATRLNGPWKMKTDKDGKPYAECVVCSRDEDKVRNEIVKYIIEDVDSVDYEDEPMLFDSFDDFETNYFD